MPKGDVTAWVTAHRGPRASVDAFRPQAVFLEEELAGSGHVVKSACVLLTNKECPWRCVMCDLWKHTLTGPTPPGAIVRQLEVALEQLGAWPEQVKLYNSGSFFDAAAIPPGEYADIAQKLAGTRNVVVESHPRLVGERTLRLRDLLDASLEVAMGLETAHEEVLARLNKRCDLRDFERACAFLRREGLAVRSFILVTPPFLGEQDGLEWVVRSAQFAFAAGADMVSLIPTRGGNGAMEELAKAGSYVPPTLRTLEEAQERVLALGLGRVSADVWGLEVFSRCGECFEARRERMHRMNLRQKVEPRVRCLGGGA